jgi:hypothetical protein
MRSNKSNPVFLNRKNAADIEKYGIERIKKFFQN